MEMNKKKRYAVFYTILFFAVCLVPSAGILFGGVQESSENRDLADPPALFQNGNINKNLLKDAGAYFEDHFAYRNEMVTANALLSGKVFGTSPDDGVVVGRRGWLYYTDSLDDYQGTDPLTDRQLFATAHTLAMMQAYTEEKGAQFIFAIAPNKNSLYGENMPYYYRYYGDGGGNAERLSAFLDEEGVHTVDLFSAFRGQDEILYHKMDSHWNNKGAVLAAGKVMDALQRPHGSYASRDYTTRRDFEGDLETMLYPALVGREEELYYTPAPAFRYEEKVENNFAPKIYTNADQQDGSLVMYRDSFGNALVPFFAEAYKKAYFSRAVPYAMADLIACEADTLVVERAERFLPEMAKNAPVMPAPIAAKADLADAAPVEIAQADFEVEEQGVYKKISGSLDTDQLETDSRIYLEVNDVLCYEAFPVTREDGTDGFTLYVAASTLDEDAEYRLLLQT